MTESDVAKAVSRATAERFYTALESDEMHKMLADLLDVFSLDPPVPMAAWPERILEAIRSQLGEQ